MMTFDIPNQMMTGSQLRKEKEEFIEVIKAYNAVLEKQADSSKQEVYTSQSKPENLQKKGYVEMTSSDWFPDRLLLIRFGLQDIAKRRPKQEENKSLPTTKLINFVSSGSIGQSAQT